MKNFFLWIYIFLIIFISCNKEEINFRNSHFLNSNKNKDLNVAEILFKRSSPKPLLRSELLKLNKPKVKIKTILNFLNRKFIFILNTEKEADEANKLASLFKKINSFNMVKSHSSLRYEVYKEKKDFPYDFQLIYDSLYKYLSKAYQISLNKENTTNPFLLDYLADLEKKCESIEGFIDPNQLEKTINPQIETLKNKYQRKETINFFEAINIDAINEAICYKKIEEEEEDIEDELI